MELIRKYFPELTSTQEDQFKDLLRIIPALNEQVNVISRKDIGHLEERHVLHSLSPAKAFPFSDLKRIIDAGTGGGFPGIPLAIMYPEIEFILVDSIAKKIHLVREAVTSLGLKNVQTLTERIEKINLTAELVVTRAVASLSRLDVWTRKRIISSECAEPNGLLALKGGDLEEELLPFGDRIQLLAISELFEEEFFLTKKIVFLKK